MKAYRGRHRRGEPVTGRPVIHDYDADEYAYICRRGDLNKW